MTKRPPRVDGEVTIGVDLLMDMRASLSRLEEGQKHTNRRVDELSGGLQDIKATQERFAMDNEQAHSATDSKLAALVERVSGIDERQDRMERRLDDLSKPAGGSSGGRRDPYEGPSKLITFAKGNVGWLLTIGTVIFGFLAALFGWKNGGDSTP